MDNIPKKNETKGFNSDKWNFKSWWKIPLISFEKQDKTQTNYRPFKYYNFHKIYDKLFSFLIRPSLWMIEQRNNSGEHSLIRPKNQILLSSSYLIILNCQSNFML